MICDTIGAIKGARSGKAIDMMSRLDKEDGEVGDRAYNGYSETVWKDL